MEEKKYHVVEWTIDNFSCWTSEIHDKVIKSPRSLYASGVTFHLFPRGLNGHDEHLLVQIHSNEPAFFSGEMSFVGSDGSILCTQQVDSKEKVSVLKLHPGLKFKEMVAQIRKAFHENRIILRLRMQRLQESNSIEYMRKTIDAFEAHFKVSPNILSVPNLSSTSWLAIARLVYPLNESNEGRMYLFAKIDPVDHSKIELSLMLFFGNEKVSVHTRLSVLNNEDVVRTEENEHMFPDDESWTFSKSLTRDEITNEGLTIILTITIIPVNTFKNSVGLIPNSVAELCYGDAIHPIKLNEFKPSGTRVPEEHFSKSRFSVDSKQANNSLTVLSSQLMCLYQDQEFSDFQLKCGDVCIPVHKNILSARSPVFKTMFSTDMREAASGCMDIVDLEPSTLGLFLTYLYTGAVEELQGESAIKLYYAADKYQVTTLKEECVDFLYDNVSVSNVCDILSLADKHQDVKLTSVAHGFILKNYNEVLRSEEWKSFMKSEPLLALETVTYFADKNLVKRS